MSGLDVPNYFKDFLWLAPLSLFMLCHFGKQCGERFPE